MFNRHQFLGSILLFYLIFRTTSEVSSKLYFVEICSQRSYGFLITKELMFGFQILDLKDHFSASLISDKSLLCQHHNKGCWFTGINLTTLMSGSGQLNLQITVLEIEKIWAKSSFLGKYWVTQKVLTFDQA